MDGEVRVGTSGWSYPSGRGTWNGIFYPPAGRRKVDELAYYAEHFNTVEVNSTFYRLPRAETARSWARRTPPGFDFSIKLFQAFTHPTMAAARGKGGKREAEGRQADVTVPAVTQADVDEFRASIGPLAADCASGK